MVYFMLIMICYGLVANSSYLYNRISRLFVAPLQMGLGKLSFTRKERRNQWILNDAEQHTQRRKPPQIDAKSEKKQAKKRPSPNHFSNSPNFPPKYKPNFSDGCLVFTNGTFSSVAPWHKRNRVLIMNSVLSRPSWTHVLCPEPLFSQTSKVE